jgi:TP901 family phage tail tape measure protein
MAGLPKAGVQLIAEGASRYFGDLARGVTAQNAFTTASGGSASAVNAFGGAAAKNAAKVAQLTDKLSFQKRAFDILQRELDETKAKYGEGSTQAQKQQLALDKLAKGIDKTTAELNKYQSGAESAGKASSTFGTVVTGALREIGAAATRFALDVGAKVLAFFTTDAVRAGMEFEKTMSGVKAVLAPTGAEFEALGQKALQLGADTAFSASEAASAIEMLAKNGLKATDILGGAADATVYLAAATGTDLSNAANIATDAMADFGISASDMTTAINGISGVTVNSKFNIDDYRLALSQAGGVAGSVGVSFQDFNTTIAAISPLFASGSDAGTSLKTMLLRLIPASDKAEAKMRQLGIITETGANQFFTASGAMKDMDQIAGVLQGAFQGLSEQEKNAALATIFGTDAMRAAVGLANVGTAGFNELAAAIGKVDAKQQAAERMNNFAGALEEASGSLETLQIVIASKVLPFLTALVRSAVVPAINAVTEFAAGTSAAGQAAAAFGAFVSENVVPAIVALGAISLLYALTQAPALIVALLAQLPALAAATAAFAANALAVAAAAAPFALIAAAIFGVVKAFQTYQTQLTSATDQLLATKPFWTDSAAAIDGLGHASAETQAKLRPLADSIQEQRDLLHSEIELLGRRMAAGAISEAQYAAEMEAINAQASAIEYASRQLVILTAAEVTSAAASLTATQRAQEQAGALDQLPPKIHLTADELAKLAKEYEDIMEQGSAALGTLATTHAAFLADMAETQGAHDATMTALMAEAQAAQTEDQRKNITARVQQEEEGYRQQTLNQAKAYREQAMAQRQALGEQLLAYIENQRQLGNVTDETSRAISARVTEQFGVQRDSAAALFGEMAQIVDSAARGEIKSMDAFGGALQETEDKAVSLREASMALEDEYVLSAVNNFLENGQDAAQLKRDLNSIPREVNIRVNTHYTSTGDRNDRGGGDGPSSFGGRALGGPVMAGTPYIVGEHRPEVFVPESSGRIVPSLAAFDRRYRPPMGRGARGAASVSSYQGPSYQWTINNPQPQAVDSLASLVRIQQLL